MPAIIEAHGLKKRYGKTIALDGLDLVAGGGQIVAVLGPNGAGKTTFVRMVATLLAPDDGTLRVAGHDALREPATVRQLIGLAGQFAAVEPAMTGRENLEMVARLFGQSRRTAKASAAAVLEQLGLVEAGDQLARTFSGGMRCRLDLGASLVGAPRLLLLDEPLAGLSQDERGIVRDLIAAIPRDTTIVMIEHDMDVALAFAERISVLHYGKLIVEGDRETVVAHPLTREVYLGV
jgi:ABC-2 type transport system ATP-binding protein